MQQHHLRKPLVAVLCPAACLGILLLPGVGPAAPKKTRPQVITFPQGDPESADDLKALQEQVKKVLKKVIPCTVAVRVAGAQGSGVIIDAEGHVLTAAHVSGKKDQDVVLIFPDGKTVKGKTLGLNRTIDSGLIKITDKGPWPYAPMGHSALLRKGDWCIATGHPGGYREGRSPVVRLGRVMHNQSDLIRTDCTLVGGDSGGPLFDLKGRVIGIHSCIGNAITANLHVPVDTYRETWDRLVKGEVWGKRPGSKATTAPYLGVEVAQNADDCTLGKVFSESPAERAGLKKGDVVLRFAGEKVGTFSDLRANVRKKKAGDRVTLEIRRGLEILKVDVVLGEQEDDG